MLLLVKRSLHSWSIGRVKSVVVRGRNAPVKPAHNGSPRIVVFVYALNICYEWFLNNFKLFICSFLGATESNGSGSSAKFGKIPSWPLLSSTAVPKFQIIPLSPLITSIWFGGVRSGVWAGVASASSPFAG